jgi:hypothetical protein
MLGSDWCRVSSGEATVGLRLGLGASSIAGRDFNGFFKATLEKAGDRLNAGLDRNAAAIESRTTLALDPAGFGLHSRESSESMLLHEEYEEQTDESRFGRTGIVSVDSFVESENRRGYVGLKSLIEVGLISLIALR